MMKVDNIFTEFCKVLWAHLRKIMESNKSREVLTDGKQNIMRFNGVRSKVY